MLTDFSPDRFSVILVENNPYDRAVIDACFEADREAVLRYAMASDESGARPIGPSDLWDLCGGVDKAADLVLLDLALTEQCEVALASQRYRHFLQNQAASLRDLDFALAEWSRSGRPLLVESTLALIGLERDSGEEEMVKTVQAMVENAADGTARFGNEKEKLLAGLSRANVATAGSILRDWWVGSKNVQTVLQMAEAPSILRIFACVASFPNRCFGVISHYASPDTQVALQTILTYRYRSTSPSERQKVARGLIVEKSALFAHGSGNYERAKGLVERLRNACALWEARESPQAAVAPFGSVPVVTPDSNVVELWECIDQIWPRLLIAPVALDGNAKSEESCIVLWDETKLIVGREGSWPASSGEGHLGWEAVLGKDFFPKGCDITDLQQFAEHRPEGRPVIYVLRQPLTKESEGTELARLIRLRVPSSPKLTVVIVGGSTEARAGLEAHLPKLDYKNVLFRIPGWIDPVWRSGRLRQVGRSIARALGLNPESRQTRKEKKRVFMQLLMELRVPVSTDDENTEAFPKLLATAVQNDGKVRKFLKRLAKELATDPSPVTRWVRLENQATDVIEYLRNGGKLMKSLEEFKLVESLKRLGSKEK